MKNEHDMLEKLVNEIVKLFATNKISYAEAGEIMYCVKKKMGEHVVQDY